MQMTRVVHRLRDSEGLRCVACSRAVIAHIEIH